MESLSQLIEKTAHKDGDALETIVQEHSSDIAQYLASRIPIDEAQIESIVQATMVNVWENASEFAGETDTEARRFLYRLAEQNAMDLLGPTARELFAFQARALARLNRYLHAASGESARPADPALSEADRPSASDLLLSELTPLEREVLSEIAQGHSVDEITQESGLERTHVYVILARIRYKFERQSRMLEISQ